jgi:putative flavoprotein involved in K+ transport
VNGKIWTLLTTMVELKGHEEHTGFNRPLGAKHGAGVNGRVKVSQRAAQNVATLGLARLPRERAPASGRPRFS